MAPLLMKSMCQCYILQCPQSVLTTSELHPCMDELASHPANQLAFSRITSSNDIHDHLLHTVAQLKQPLHMLSFILPLCFTLMLILCLCIRRHTQPCAALKILNMYTAAALCNPLLNAVGLHSQPAVPRGFREKSTVPMVTVPVVGAVGFESQSASDAVPLG